MTVEEIRALVRKSLEDLKAQDIVELDVTDKTSVTDYLFIATGTSSRHVKSIANNVFQDAKDAGLQPLGMEGEADADWVLVDLGDVIVHVLQPQSREFYDLESLWRLDVLQRERHDQDASDLS
jgi:ribosome-associated protein